MPSYPYDGDHTRIYVSYVDTVTQQTLVAVPGRTYQVRAVEKNLVVPPPDGRWGLAMMASSLSPVTTTPSTASKKDEKTGDE